MWFGCVRILRSAQNDGLGIAQNDGLGIAQNDGLGIAQNDGRPRTGIGPVETEYILMTSAGSVSRCAWATGHPLLQEYHDAEWGVPVHDDRTHFEYLVLDGAQAGLSWLTVLKKREGYRAAFADFDPQAVAAYSEADVERLLADPGIIRNRAKVVGAIESARAFLRVQEEFGAFDPYIWQFTEGRTRVNNFTLPGEVPATSPQSDAMSKDLRKRGFKFVGSTICYAYMQAAGMVNDHTTNCFRFEACCR